MEHLVLQVALVYGSTFGVPWVVGVIDVRECPAVEARAWMEHLVLKVGPRVQRNHRKVVHCALGCGMG